MENTILNLVTAAARTASTYTSPLLSNRHWRGGHFVIAFTSAQGSTSTLTVTVEGLLAGTTATFYTVLASTPLTSEQTRTLKVYPGLTAAANNVGNDFLPSKYRVKCVNVGVQTIKASVAASLSL